MRSNRGFWLLLLLALAAPLPADTGSLSLRLAVYNPDQGPVRMVLRVENLSGHEVTLHQATAQAYDFAIYSGEREVWKWSSGTFFIQATSQRVLAPGEILSYSEDWDRRDRQGAKAPAGRYTVKAWLPTLEGGFQAEPRTLLLSGK